MKKIARFEKVSREEYLKDYHFAGDAHEIYDNILLPKRSTTGSAGYDIYSPIDIVLKPGESIVVPTGIRVLIDEGWVLKIYPRSSMGFKYRLQLDNTVGIIDSDYSKAENEGHIFTKITNDTHNNVDVIIKKGQAYLQGIFLEYGITYDDEASENRIGGIGSTDK